MKNNHDKTQRYIRAKNKVKNIKIFYIHLVGYVIILILLLYNLYIVEGEYKDFFIWFNLTVLAAWTVFILLHGLSVFRGVKLFKKSWENRKMQEFLEEEKETTIWK